MENILDFRVICCTCLNVTHSTISVYHRDLKYNVLLVEMINKISHIELKPTDEYPNKLCYTCADKLRIAYEFRMMCDDSNNILLSHRKHSKELAPAHPEAEHLVHDESLLLAETSNDFIEYDGVEEYLEEYLLETEETVPSNEEQNTEQHTNISVAEKDIIPPEFDEKEEYLLCNDSPKSDTKSTIIDDAEAAEVTENKCPICGQILSKMAHLRRHLKLHNRTKSFRCTQCPKVFSRSDNLRAHEKNHSQERHYKCPQCDQRFKRMDALKVHMSVRHKQYVEAHFHVCSYCNTFFETEQKLNAHLAKRRSEKKFVCHICGKTFAELLRYEIHLEKHANAGSNVETFECFHCSKLFDSKKRLSLHIRYHTSDKVYKCKYCDESFARKTELKYHEDYHTGTKNHVCKTCGQSFYRLNALKTHMMTHTDEKPFQCSHCPKRFRQKYDMITHERRHTGERFQCDMCTEKFIHAHQLNSHLKIVHDLNVKCRKRGVTKFFPASDKHTEDRPENDAKSSSSRNEN
ncbi:zinc finger protein 16-like [Anopheles maculipalpis]|uniref:zinc finger protein 16-like n=1 Tax=Anopheles maculipalpis TaxID=1496333 RepID=UPI00215926A0|nr:zinc finger protein 16-like [Anopheles maculipalpis]